MTTIKQVVQKAINETLANRKKTLTENNSGLEEIPAKKPVERLDISNDIGDICVVLKPSENKVPEDIVVTTNLSQLFSDVVAGKLNLSNVAEVYRKPVKALRRAGKLIREFDHNLVSGWKANLSEYQKKVDFLQSQLAATNRYYADKTLDEDQINKINSAEQKIADYTDQIAQLNEKISSYKRSR